MLETVPFLCDNENLPGFDRQELDIAFNGIAANIRTDSGQAPVGPDREQLPYGVTQGLMPDMDMQPMLGTWLSGTGSRMVGKTDISTDTKTDTSA